jgi:hypothetical protein
MTPLLYNELKDLVTVHGAGRVNINTAEARVLEAVGLERSLADKILEFRRGPDAAAGPEDDGVFPQTGSIAPVLAQFTTLTAEESASLLNALGQNRLTVQLDNVRLNISARLNDGRAFKEFSIVISARNPPGRILSWREGI